MTEDLGFCFNIPQKEKNVDETTVAITWFLLRLGVV